MAGQILNFSALITCAILEHTVNKANENFSGHMHALPPDYDRLSGNARKAACAEIAPLPRITC